MRRSTWGRSVGPARPILALLAFLLTTVGCDARTGSPAPAASPTQAASAAPGPSATNAPPTPVPTVVPGSGGPFPTATAVAAEARLLIRFVSCGDTCQASAGTTILDDGRAIWETSDGSGRVVEARLSETGLARVRAAIAAEAALGTKADYRAELRAGGVAIPHGLSSLRFEVGGPASVVVTSWDPASLADQRDQWRIPPAMDALGELARKLADPLRWLGAVAFATQPERYTTDRFLVVIDLFGDVGDTGAFAADADDV